MYFHFPEKEWETVQNDLDKSYFAVIANELNYLTLVETCTAVTEKGAYLPILYKPYMKRVTLNWGRIP